MQYMRNDLYAIWYMMERFGENVVDGLSVGADKCNPALYQQLSVQIFWK